MPTVSQQVRSFHLGEVSPQFYKRFDLESHGSMCQIMRNMIPLQSGGAERRLGFKYINATRYSGTKVCFLTSFIFSVVQAYLLEFGHQYIRFYMNSGQINVSGVGAYNAGTAYVIGDLCVSGGVNYYCIKATTGNAPPNATYWYALTGTIYEIPTPYQEADLELLKFEQSADYLYITHPSYSPAALTRSAHTNWKYTIIQYTPSIPSPQNLTSSSGTGLPAPLNFAVTTHGTGALRNWVVTAYNGSTESPVSNTLYAEDGSTFSWSSVATATGYKIYGYGTK